MKIFLKILLGAAMFLAVFTQQTIAAAPTVVQTPVSSQQAELKPEFAAAEVPVQTVPVRTAPVKAATVDPVAFESGYGRLVIPSISLDKAIAPVGLTSTGAMDVLNDPNRVGWYNKGVLPGKVGSAVLDAHVYQAFGKLKYLELGDEIYVTQADGSRLLFRINEIEVYPYTDTAHLGKIFARNDAARLTLITCHGDLTADRSTYTQRLVVFATLVS